MSHPLGLRAKLKGPQAKKRTLMKHQVNTYFIQVRLPAALQRSLRSLSNDVGGDDGAANRSMMATTMRAPQLLGKFGGHKATSPLSSSSVRLPLFSDEELQSPTYSTAYRGVVTVTIPSGASCYDAVGCILAAANATDRSPRDYQLVQCFADFTPDHTRQRLTGDSTSVPIKTVMQFPFHLALVLSPYVVLREQLEEDEEPHERSAVADAYRKQFVQFCSGYQTLLFRLIEQANFLRGREEEARRGKKLEERQQFYELTRFGTLREEKSGRHNIERVQEMLCRSLIHTEERALSEKLMLCDACESPWLREHAVAIKAIRARLDHVGVEDALLRKLRLRMDDLARWYSQAADSVVHAKQRHYTVGRAELCLNESVAMGDVTVVTAPVVEAHRRALAPTLAPQWYGVPMVANAAAILEDVHSSSRSHIL